jgi:hypothetical protein
MIKSQRITSIYSKLFRSFNGWMSCIPDDESADGVAKVIYDLDRSEFYFILALYSLRLLLTTEILLKAMARAAKMGCSCRSMIGKVSKG